MPLTHQQILDFVRTNGPSVPNDIRQALKAQDNFVVGAMLGELTSQGKLKMTDLSLGTSRFYYDPSAPERLENVGQHLNEKNARAFTLLKERRVLRHSELEPIMRVAMVNIPDYSRAVRYRHTTAAAAEVNGSEEELFWRYYLVPEQEAIALIEQTWFGKRPAVTAPAASPSVSVPSVSVTSEPVATLRFGKKPVKPSQAPVSVPKKARKTEKTMAEPQASLPEAEKPQKPAEGFAKQVQDYFGTKAISITQQLKATKTELTAIVSIPSAVGTVTYFCKAKGKKSASDGDLASALLEAQHHKLPLFYVAGGTLSKRAQSLLLSELKGIVAVTPWA